MPVITSDGSQDLGAPLALYLTSPIVKISKNGFSSRVRKIKWLQYHPDVLRPAHASKKHLFLSEAHRLLDGDGQLLLQLLHVLVGW